MLPDADGKECVVVVTWRMVWVGELNRKGVCSVSVKAASWW